MRDNLVLILAIFVVIGAVLGLGAISLYNKVTSCNAKGGVLIEGTCFDSKVILK